MIHNNIVDDLQNRMAGERTHCLVGRLGQDLDLGARLGYVANGGRARANQEVLAYELLVRYGRLVLHRAEIVLSECILFYVFKLISEKKKKPTLSTNHTSELHGFLFGR